MHLCHAGSSRQQSIVIVLDEFQEFTSFSDQRLLYNLFDIAQTIATPLTVVALSPHVVSKDTTYAILFFLYMHVFGSVYVARFFSFFSPFVC